MPLFSLLGIAIAVCFVAALAAAYWWLLRTPPARPAAPPPGRPTALVPVTDLTSTEWAVGMACRVEGAPDVVLLHVAAVPLTLPLDADLGEQEAERTELLALGRVIARRAGRAARQRSLRDRDLASAVLRVAAEECAQAIVIGVPEPGSPRAHEWARTAARVQRRARCEVIVHTAIRRGRGAPTAVCAAPMPA